MDEDDDENWNSGDDDDEVDQTETIVDELRRSFKLFDAKFGVVKLAVMKKPSDNEPVMQKPKQKSMDIPCTPKKNNLQ